MTTTGGLIMGWRHVGVLAQAHGVGVEHLDGDNRHGLGARGWLTLRVPITPGKRWRRFYLHEAGWLVEGGRGGARVFDVREPPSPHPYRPELILDRALIRCASIALAADIAEALGWRAS